LERNFKSLIVVISPLISLILDQDRALKENDLSAIYLSNIAEEVHEDVCNGCYQVVFMSPEALLADTERRDMPHCVKKW